MELTCLNCTGSFSVDDGEPAGRGSLRCPLCGREQRWLPQEDFVDPVPADAPVEALVEVPVASAPTPEPSPQPAAAPRAEPAASAFRRPMQAFTGMRGAKPAAPRMGQPIIPRGVDDPDVSTGSGLAGDASDDAARISLDDVPQLAEESPIVGDPESWVVRSPSGLVLEFPSSNLLLAWSAVLDNPLPYQVSHGGGLWTSLDQVIREQKRGTRSTQAFLKTLDGGAVGGRPAIDPARRDRMELGDPLARPQGAPTEAGAVLPPLDRAIPSTSQFQFKIATPKPKGLPGWVVLAAVTVGVLAAAGIAAYFLFLH